MEKLKFFLVVLAVRLQGIQHLGMDDPREKIVEENVLIVKTNEFLDVFERQSGIVLDGAIVKTMKQSLKLRDDRIFVVAWISNKCARRVCRVVGVSWRIAGQVRDLELASGEWLA